MKPKERVLEFWDLQDKQIEPAFFFYAVFFSCFKIACLFHNLLLKKKVLHQFYDSIYEELKGHKEASFSLGWDIKCGDTQSGINTFCGLYFRFVSLEYWQGWERDINTRKTQNI